MQLNFEHTQEIALGTMPSAVHFPKNIFRVFFIDPENQNMIYQVKTETPYGNFENREFSEKSPAYAIPHVRYFSTYYTPRKFLLAIAIFDDRISFLVYNEELEKFQTFQNLIYDMDYEIPKPEADIFLHTQPIQQKFVKIEVLNFDEIPFAEIEGQVIDGHITIDSESSVRRVCDLTLIHSEDLLPDINKIIWLDRKFKVWLGIKDLMTDEIKWYNFGIFVISNPTVDIELGLKTMTIKGYDKSCFLNGNIAGQLESITRIDAKTPLFSAIGSIVSQLGREKKVFINAEDCFLEDMKDVRVYNPVKDGKTYDSYFAFKGDITVKRNGQIVMLQEYTVDYSNYIIIFHEKQNEEDIITIDGTMIYTVPYNIEKSTSNTVWDLIDDITKLYMSFQSYYDINGYFIFNKLKTSPAGKYVWDFTDYDIRLRCTNNFDTNNVRNYFKVLGAVQDDMIQILAEEEIDDVDIPYSTENVARRPLVISEDTYFTHEACQERLEYEKFKHTNFNEQVTCECIPLLFLDVNSLVRLYFPEDGIDGVYSITKISLPMKYDGMMNFDAYKVY